MVEQKVLTWLGLCTIVGKNVLGVIGSCVSGVLMLEADGFKLEFGEDCVGCGV